MSDDIYLKNMNVNNGGLDMELEGSPLHVMAACFVEQFKESEAVNYLELTFRDKDSEDKYVLTMQKSDGITPAGKVAQLKGAIETMISCIDDDGTNCMSDER